MSDPLGALVITRGASHALAAGGKSPADLLRRHACGDGGELKDDDRRLNVRGVKTGSGLLSSHTLPKTGREVWVITEGERGTTTILLPEEC